MVIRFFFILILVVPSSMYSMEQRQIIRIIRNTQIVNQMRGFEWSPEQLERFITGFPFQYGREIKTLKELKLLQKIKAVASVSQQENAMGELTIVIDFSGDQEEEVFALIGQSQFMLGLDDLDVRPSDENDRANFDFAEAGNKQYQIKNNAVVCAFGADEGQKSSSLTSDWFVGMLTQDPGELDE